MIIIIGCAGAGKSTIEKELTKIGHKKITSYTSRPIRANEKNDIDYHFITEEKFKNNLESGFFAEHTKYNGWFYGIAKKDCHDDSIVVVEPYGFRQLKSKPELNVSSIFIDVPERIRLKRMVDRGDNLMEVFRRIFSDQGVFQGIEDEVNYVINNDRPLEKTMDEILLILDKQTEV
jgi:guanylate kinase